MCLRSFPTAAKTPRWDAVDLWVRDKPEHAGTLLAFYICFITKSGALFLLQGVSLIMQPASSGDIPRQIETTPPVNIETFASHVTLTWTSLGLSQFVDIADRVDVVPADSTPIVDATNAAGRRRLPLTEIDTTTAATKYVRFEPDCPWTLAWERRTTPVVSLCGSPSPTVCQQAHIITTTENLDARDGWNTVETAAGWTRETYETLLSVLGA